MKLEGRETLAAGLCDGRLVGSKRDFSGRTPAAAWLVLPICANFARLHFLLFVSRPPYYIFGVFLCNSDTRSEEVAGRFNWRMKNGSFYMKGLAGGGGRYPSMNNDPGRVAPRSCSVCGTGRLLYPSPRE